MSKIIICFVGVVVKDIERGLGFDSRAGQIGYCSQELNTAASFLFCPDAKSFCPNTASIMKVFLI